MIDIKNNSDCCGCGACVQTCSHRAISMHTDSEGFLYPIVNTQLCVDCGLCDRICPIINGKSTKEPLNTYAAFNYDSTTQFNSSSGGVFALLASKILQDDGIVFGAKYDVNWQTRMDSIDNENNLHLFFGSKYVQASVGDAFSRCKDYLINDNSVLFTGTPCQIAGLKSFLRKEYDKLYTVDVACHGVPSPLVWDKYIRHVNSIISSNDPDYIYRALKDLHFEIYYNRIKDCVELKSNRHRNEYMLAFIHSLSLRPSCYNCRFKNFSSGSDLTIADFWGIEKVAPDMKSKLGTSLVIINSDKGRRLWKSIKCSNIETDVIASIQENPALTASSLRPSDRSFLFDGLMREPIIEGLRKSLHYIYLRQNTVTARFRRFVKKIFCFLKDMFARHNNGLELINNSHRLERVISNSKLEIISVDFRDKYFSWQKYCLSIIISKEDK